MENLITLMRRRFPVDMEAAARLGISRQAYSQSIKRGRFSNETALRCADLLEIDRAAALLCNCPAAEYLPAPVSNPTPYAPAELHITCFNTTNYAAFSGIKKSARSAYNPDLFIRSPPQNKKKPST